MVRKGTLINTVVLSVEQISSVNGTYNTEEKQNAYACDLCDAIEKCIFWIYTYDTGGVAGATIQLYSDDNTNSWRGWYEGTVYSNDGTP